ncbi:MAG: proton-conducting membrane transporter [Defluviitaleaceae bacterium]|nr:proton-conducting membrane transporter [Defluviitaleaceae bacterium]
MLIYFVIVPILLAVFLYLFPFERAARTIAILAQMGLVGASVYLFTLSRENSVVTAIGNYDDVLGIFLRADTLSAVFILLTSFIFFIAAIYSFNENKSRLFWFLLFIWEGSLIGIFLAGDFFNLFVLTEVATVTITILIMYDRNKRALYDGIIFFMVNIVVVQFYLLGLGYIYQLTGVLDLEAAGAAFQGLERSQMILPYALVMTFVALKCALLPMFSWLPKAHSTPGAPPAVSAVLSGLQIKGGVYLLIRFQAIFGDGAMPEFFLILGLTTALFGIILALVQVDFKRILACSTIAQIGLIVVAINIGNYYNYIGSLYHMVNHAVIKAALFLCAGMIVHSYGTRDITKIRGIMRQMPLVGISMILALLGIIGMPFFNGSISKYFMMYHVEGPLFWIMLLINLGTIMIGIKLSAMLFGRLEEKEKPTQDILQLISVLILGLMCFGLGVFGESVMLILFNGEFRMDWFGYLEKSAIFAASLVVGYFIFNKFIKNNPYLKTIREIELGFRGMCVTMGVFFALILLVAGI